MRDHVQTSEVDFVSSLKTVDKAIQHAVDKVERLSEDQIGFSEEIFADVLGDVEQSIQLEFQSLNGGIWSIYREIEKRLENFHRRITRLGREGREEVHHGISSREEESQRGEGIAFELHIEGS